MASIAWDSGAGLSVLYWRYLFCWLSGETRWRVADYYHRTGGEAASVDHSDGGAGNTAEILASSRRAPGITTAVPRVEALPDRAGDRRVVRCASKVCLRCSGLFRRIVELTEPGGHYVSSPRRCSVGFNWAF